MELTQQIALIAAMGFFVFGLLTGVWKYAALHASPAAQAPAYVDVCHRASLLYAFACLLLERMAEVSQLAPAVELPAVLAPLTFFALAVVTYAVHGLLDDTDDQLRRPHKLGRYVLPTWLTPAFMVALIVAEVGGALVLAFGVLAAL